MKPDIWDTILEEINQAQEQTSAAEDIVRQSEPTDEEIIWKPTDENIICIFSCVMQTKIDKLKEKLTHILDSRPEIDKYKIYLKEEYKDFICIGFSSELFDLSPSKIRSLFYSLCNGLVATSCSVSTKNDKCWDCAYFLKDELSLDNWKEGSSSKDSFVDYFESKKEIIYNLSTFNYDFLKSRSIYHSDNLLIRNVDSERNIEKEEIDFIKEIVKDCLENDPNWRFPLADDNIFRMMYYPECNPSIPIVLKKVTKSYEELWKGLEGNIRDYRPKGNVLGYYTRMDDDFCGGPHIIISPENVEGAALNAGIPFHVLFTKVLVHELAHASMDKYRLLQNGYLMYNNISENWCKTIEAKAMEESLANMITLSCFKKYASPEEYKQVKHFIDCWQSSIYRFGLWQDKIDADWKKWLNSDKQATDKLSDWFNRCFSSGNIKIPIEDYNKDLYDKVFG